MVKHRLYLLYELQKPSLPYTSTSIENLLPYGLASKWMLRRCFRRTNLVMTSVKGISDSFWDFPLSLRSFKQLKLHFLSLSVTQSLYQKCPSNSRTPFSLAQRCLLWWVTVTVTVGLILVFSVVRTGGYWIFTDGENVFVKCLVDIKCSVQIIDIIKLFWWLLNNENIMCF